jgi:hypothetical protein
MVLFLHKVAEYIDSIITFRTNVKHQNPNGFCCNDIYICEGMMFLESSLCHFLFAHRAQSVQSHLKYRLPKEATTLPSKINTLSTSLFSIHALFPYRPKKTLAGSFQYALRQSLGITFNMFDVHAH